MGVHSHTRHRCKLLDTEKVGPAPLLQCLQAQTIFSAQGGSGLWVGVASTKAALAW